MKKAGVNVADNILQMDIEGSEYSVILDTPIETLKKFRIILIEFHDFDLLFSKFGFDIIESCFNKLLREFKVVHIHPNNCCGSFVQNGISLPRVLEFSFINKNRLSKIDYSNATDFPHNLDVKNVKELEEITLPNIFFKNE